MHPLLQEAVNDAAAKAAAKAARGKQRLRPPTPADLARLRKAGADRRATLSTSAAVPTGKPEQPRGPLGQAVANAIKSGTATPEQPTGLVAAALAKAHGRRTRSATAMRKSGSSNPVAQRMSSWGERHGRGRTR